ncbi:ATP-binding protein [Streptomyces umbrinus]|uniref:ATP-binding protein n=1 Tax=Streptomyces umbrinus TaxID=67370 RepID=UPI003C2BE675
MAPPSLPKPLGRLPASEHPHRAGVFGLSPTPASVGVARRNVRELLSEWGASPETCDNAVLVTSELVTNALTHTASEWIVCRLRTAGGRLHIEVEDQNRGLTLPAQRSAGPDDQGGRGLMLVGMVSSDWGVKDSANGSGRVVWAVLPSQPVPSPPASSPPVSLRSVPPQPTSSESRGPVPTGRAPSTHEPASTGRAPSTHLTRPNPHSAEGHLPHGTPARP